jgi:hypothetical protein
MDQPLFAPESNNEQTITLIGGGFLALFTSVTIIISWIKTATSSGVHFFFGANVGCYAAITVFLIRWYRIGDLDPKFKYMITALSLSLLFQCIVGLCYMF